MTRDQLRKKLVFIKGQPLLPKVDPIERARRDVSQIENTSEFDRSEFDNFFEFEEDLAELESARKQVERLELNKINSGYLETTLNEPEEETFLLLSEDEEIKSGEDDSFLTFDIEEETKEPEPEPEIIPEPKEEIPEDLPEPDNLDEFGNPKLYTQVEGFEFVYCAHIKKDGTRCKRQAPKKSIYCSSHRKR